MYGVKGASQYKGLVVLCCVVSRYRDGIPSFFFNYQKMDLKSRCNDYKLENLSRSHRRVKKSNRSDIKLFGPSSYLHGLSSSDRLVSRVLRVDDT